MLLTLGQLSDDPAVFESQPQQHDVRSGLELRREPQVDRRRAEYGLDHEIRVESNFAGLLAPEHRLACPGLQHDPLDERTEALGRITARSIDVEIHAQARGGFEADGVGVSLGAQASYERCFGGRLAQARA